MREKIEAAFGNRSLLEDGEHRQAVFDTIAALDRGELRVAEKRGDGWESNAWVMKAINLYFTVAGMETVEAGPFEYHDKIPTKKNLAEAGVRVVPPGTVRYGAFVERGVVVMPGYVNIGAHVGSGTMVDTWATVGSGAQIGRNVQLAGGVRVGEGAVLGANVVLNESIPIIDVTGEEPVPYRGYVPPRSVVVPGTRTRQFPAGSYDLQTPLIVGERRPSTDEKTSLNDALREFGIGAGGGG